MINRNLSVPFFISSSLLPLDLLYFKSVAVLMYDVSNNTSPPQISNLFNYQHNIYSHNTRSSTRGNFFLEYSRLDKLNMSFSRNGVRVWNNLSNEIRQMPKVKFTWFQNDYQLYNMYTSTYFSNFLQFVTAPKKLISLD